VDILLQRAGSYRRPHHDACQDETGLLQASRYTCVRVTQAGSPLSQYDSLACLLFMLSCSLGVSW
jgi:hypothetical protein